MSDIIDISVAHNNARLLASQAFLDLGSANAKLHLFGTTRPSPGASPGGSALATITLAKPSGTINSDRLELEMDDPGGYMIATTGAALWGRLENGNGDWAGDGDVTDAAGDGAFKLQGTGTNLYAGGYVLLGSATLE